MDCPCCTGASYQDCCQPFIEGVSFPKTAQELMRSRYTAFSLNNPDYIGKTQAGRAAEDYDPEGTSEWIKTCNWKSLEILNTKTLSPIRSSVEFIAHYEEKGSPRTIHEDSLFQYMNDRWYYVGSAQKKAHLPKVSRNSACPCGSGKKYKKCCDNK